MGDEYDPAESQEVDEGYEKARAEGAPNEEGQDYAGKGGESKPAKKAAEK